MMQQTSLEAFWSITTPKLNRNQKIILEALEDIAPASSKQIAAHINWPINSVTPRVLELRQRHEVVQAHIGKDTSGRRAIYWQPKTNKEHGDS